jgi:Mn-containing catalase
MSPGVLAVTRTQQRSTHMILRIDRLAIELPAPRHPSPNSASAVQELLGGKFGEMSTLMNYTFQSFNFRGSDKMKPFYDLIANIAAEEYGHIELVSHTINMLLTDPLHVGPIHPTRRSRSRPTPATITTSLRAVSRHCRSIRWAIPGTAPTCFPAAT